MKNEILEEINKFKLLSHYDNNKTLNENFTSIISEDGIVKNVLKTGKEVEAAKAALSADKSLLKAGVKVDGVALKSADDILNALKAEKITGTELAKVNKSLLNSTETSLKLKNAIAKDISLSSKFLEDYSKLTEQEALNKLMSKGYTTEQANMITGQYKKSGKSFGTGALAKDSSTVDKSVTNKNKAKGGNVVNNNNITLTQSQGGLAAGSKFKIEGKTYLVDEKGVIIDMKTGGPVRKTAIKPNGEQIILDGKNAAPTTKELKELETMKDSLNKASLKVMTSDINWKRLVGWAAGLGITAGLLWWYFATNDDKKVPDDIPTTPPKDGDNSGGGDEGDFPLEDGAYTTPGDPYQYKVVECVWFTKSWKNRGKIISDWISLANNQKAITILDGRFPDARKNCSGNTTPITTTGSTSTQDVVNQQYGVSPQPNAQPEVQTTNDDINNY